jgi:hypothetical protein
MPKYVSVPGLSVSGSNSDDGQASANVGGDNGGDGDDGGNGDYNGEDGGNEDWALSDENDNDFYNIPFCASSGYKLPRNGLLMLFLVELCLKK